MNSDSSSSSSHSNNMKPKELEQDMLAAFHANSAVMDLTLVNIVNLRDAALGICLSGLMQNMPQLQKLGCKRLYMYNETVIRAFQPGLRTESFLVQR
jgi:hypothetical protein